MKLGNIIAAITLALILPSFLLASDAALPEVYGETYYAELSEMYSRLRDSDGKRLLIIGNSDVAFGLNGELLENILREKGFYYTVCPFGLYGAVGTSAMLELSKGELREGDMAVIVVEPLSSVMSTYFGAMAFLKCAENDKSLIMPLTYDMKRELAGSLVPYLQERYELWESGENPGSGDAYAKSSFSERCDMIYDRPGNIMQLGFDTAVPIDFSAVTIDDAFIEEVNGFISCANGVGAQVAVSFSPVNALAVQDASQESVGEYFTLVNESFNCPVISDPNNYILEGDWFYDSNLHLNSAGAVVRTAELAADILAYLGCSSPVDVALPEMPEPVSAAAAAAEGDADAFKFSPIADGAGYIVSGLTENGTKSESLTVPSLFDGKPVVGFAENALNGSERLRELTIPASVESLPDNLFYGAQGVFRLVIEHRETMLMVTDHTFDGTEGIRVFIPRSDWSIYRDGAGCAVNPWEEYLDMISLC